MVKLFKWFKAIWFKKKLYKKFCILCKSSLWLENHGYSIDSNFPSFNDYLRNNFYEKNL